MQVPKTRRAWLASEGFTDRRFTLHVFVRYEEVSPDNLVTADGYGPRSLRPGQALIYQCTDTGTERRWGLE